MNTVSKITAAILVILISLSSCNKDKDKVEMGISDEYYVKYVIKGNGTYIYFSDFSVNTDQGNVSFSGYQYHSWNQTYGPVRKGFRASVSVGSSVTVEIYVSKNNGPFALKASKSGGNSSLTPNISQSYTIDF